MATTHEYTNLTAAAERSALLLLGLFYDCVMMINLHSIQCIPVLHKDCIARINAQVNYCKVETVTKRKNFYTVSQKVPTFKPPPP